MVSSGITEIGKGHYIKYDGKNMNYRVRDDKSKAMTANQMDGCWEASKTYCTEIIKKQASKIDADEKKLLSVNKKAME